MCVFQQFCTAATDENSRFCKALAKLMDVLASSLW